MIFVKRDMAAPARLDLTDENSAAFKELANAREVLKNTGKTLKSDKFKAYSHETVRNALRTLFNGKCAYCESSIAGSQDTDIEHYRPKAGVTEAEKAGVKHDGYWWLAMRWENLVLSCMHCNQQRKQIVIPEGVTDPDVIAELIENNDKDTVGKKNSFPTEDNKWITSADDNIADERPLIIDPTQTDPQLHLDWVLNETSSTVRAKNNSLLGDASVKVLGLNRRFVEEARRTRMLELTRQRNLVIKAINKALETDNDDIAAIHNATALDNIETLREMADAKQPFAGMARAFLEIVTKEVEDMQS
ncbi:MAG: hypothetical protein HKN85_02610 [Gammaproteobacteria bacterium]|nr:hypothetical protein [Gammaproteobacteria bacterium]